MPENEKQTEKHENIFKTKYGKPAWQDWRANIKNTSAADDKV